MGGAWSLAAQVMSSAPPRDASCVTDSAGADLDGLPIASVAIKPSEPRLTGPFAPLVRRLHATTRSATIERHLLFRAGDPWNSLAVDVSGRRLRALPFLASARVTSARCADGSVLVTVETADEWSTTPEGHYTEREQTLGLHESNVLGSGRAAAVVLRWELDAATGKYRFGEELSAEDPTLRDMMRVTGAYARFSDGWRWRTGASRHEHSVADRWLLGGGVQEALQRGDTATTLHAARMRAEILAGRRLTSDGTSSALYLLGGVARERVDLRTADGALALGPRVVRRAFDGVLVGLARRAVNYDAVTWILPAGGIIDLPRSTESETVFGFGRDARRGLAAVTADGWIGRSVQPSARSLLTAALWFQGFADVRAPWSAFDAGRSSTASTRISAAAIAGPIERRWTAVVAAEQLLRPDPDAIDFVTYDVTAPLLVPDARRAATTVVARLERSTHIRRVSGGLALEGAAFTALSSRWGSVATSANERLAIGGVGLQLVPTRQGSPTVRLDLDYPFLAPLDVGHRPRLVVVVQPALGQVRGRLGALVP